MPDVANQTTRELEGLLRELTRKESIAQAVVAVESGDGFFRWVGTEGTTTSGEPVTEDTPFLIASIDKLYNATITLMLREAGRLDLDEAITAYLPSTVTRGLHRYRGDDYSEKITLRHLLTHTSGLPDWLEDYPKNGSSLVDSILEEGDRALTIEEVAAYVREHLQSHFPPQDLTRKRPKVRYSDTNFMLIIAIIEAVTGEPLQEVHQRKLYEPLGLDRPTSPGAVSPGAGVGSP
jgi:CubicO group peptidase (beta-lactamase class C family)